MGMTKTKEELKNGRTEITLESLWLGLLFVVGPVSLIFGALNEDLISFFIGMMWTVVVFILGAQLVGKIIKQALSEREAGLCD